MRISEQPSLFEIWNSEKEENSKFQKFAAVPVASHFPALKIAAEEESM